MNYMKQVAEMLGLEWDDEKGESEEFDIEGCSMKYKLTEKGLFYICITGNLMPNNTLLIQILIHSDRIKKQPWKPNMNEHYYTVDLINTHQPYSQHFWKEGEHDIHRLKHGLVHRTAGEALERAKEILKMLEVQGE